VPNIRQYSRLNWEALSRQLSGEHVKGSLMTARRLPVDLSPTILLFAALAVICWALGYFRDSPLLDALGSVFAIIALVTKLAKKPRAR
jgi:hypothetical protein